MGYLIAEDASGNLEITEQTAQKNIKIEPGSSGILDLHGNTSISGTLTVSSNVSVSGTLTVTGNTSVSGTLTVSDDASVNGTLTMADNIIMTEYKTVDGVDINIHNHSGATGDGEQINYHDLTGLPYIANNSTILVAKDGGYWSIEVIHGIVASFEPWYEP
jgi:hypothetical protein